MTGWTLGGGVEYMFTSNWMGRVEYLYEDFGSFNAPFGVRASNWHIEIDAHKLRVGISYKFGR